MWNFLNFLSATAKVACDKTVDYVSYYTNLNNLDGKDSILTSNNIDCYISTDDNIDDTIENYQNLLNIEKYTDEKENDRILPEIGYYEMYSTFIDYPTHIIENIYLGSAYNAAHYENLKKFDIKVILNITTEISDYYPDEFTYIRYDLYDNNKDSILQYLENAFQQIKYHQRNTEGNILVHCFQGRSRSASVVLYYLMKTQKHKDGTPYSFDDALEYLKKKRPVINPTFKFTKDLAQSMIQ